MNKQAYKQNPVINSYKLPFGGSYIKSIKTIVNGVPNNSQNTSDI